MTDDPDPPSRLRYPRASCDVSVVLCTRNGEPWIASLLASIAAQTTPPDELIVQDDCSDDGTRQVLEDFARDAPFEVQLVVNEKPLGSTANFAAALGRCHGRFIALADQDDVWYPIKVQHLVRELELDPTVTMVFSDADLIDEQGTALGRRLWDTRMVGHTLRRRAVVPEQLFARRALTTGCTMAVRRRAVAAALPFPQVLADDAAPMRHDRWLSLIAAAVGTVRALPEPLLAFRVHPAQETGVLIGPQLFNAIVRSAVNVVFDGGRGDERGHVARAAQLEVAAERAEEVGDFEEASTLRDIAAHLRRRVGSAKSRRQRLRAVSEDLRFGAYGWDRLGVGAAAADGVRALVRRRVDHRTSRMST